MILITLAGDSSRFFEAGYSIVKYKLLLGKKSVLELILDYIPRDEKILIVLNRKFNDFEFISNLLNAMSFVSFKVVEIDKTSGQFESTILGLEEASDFWVESDPLTIYNGDTIRKLNIWNFDNCDGFIEVFESEGLHWSFVDKIGKVNQVTEKNRISSYCSSGLYFFKHIKYILEIRNEYINSNLGEPYIAPSYNMLINKGLNIISGNVDKNSFIFCGTPHEYIVANKLILQ
jgi:dTDP-glucose pyrophosphorylase